MMDDPLLERMQCAIRAAAGCRKIGVAFSGGVDSTLVARICADTNHDVTLLTVGFAGSHDIAFAGEVNHILGMRHVTLEIEPAGFGGVAAAVRRAMNTENLSWVENGIAFHYIARLAQSAGIDTVMTANGMDELFCGYDAYRGALGRGDVQSMMDAKIENELHMMEAIGTAVSQFGVRLVQPLLSADFIKYAKTIPICEKIHGPDDMLRKHTVRELARRAGVPEISAGKRKKALQYGSRIHREILKL